jgi:hypothetical protein
MELRVAFSSFAAAKAMMISTGDPRSRRRKLRKKTWTQPSAVALPQVWKA